jgi:hypothetical protein
MTGWGGDVWLLYGSSVLYRRAIQFKKFKPGAYRRATPATLCNHRRLGRYKFTFPRSYNTNLYI